ncbi:uncharacterized protein LOC144105545 [Amblyomma americanum]
MLTGGPWQRRDPRRRHFGKMWIALLLCTFVKLASGDTQNIKFRSCADHPNAKDAEIKSAVARDLEVGKTFSIDVAVVFNKEINSDPKLNLTIFTSNKVKIACWVSFNAGSCVYKLCNGATPMEKFLSAAWDSKCPIAAKEYKKTAGLFIPPIARLVMGDGRLHLRGELINGGQVVACQEFDVTVKV